MVRLCIVDQNDELDDEEQRALDDAIDEAAASIARGESVSAEEVLRILDADP